jgi:leukemia factor-related protein
VCRKHVADLSHHFAIEHGDQQQSQEITPQGLLSGGGASVTRIIPIVLPSQPASRAAQSLLSDDSEAHLLESVVSKPGQQISPFNGGDNYKSNGGSTRSSTPNSIINDNPVNLSMRREFQQPEDQSIETNSSDGSSGLYIAGSASDSDLGRKRRKQTHVPDNNKDERYWARRLKNNEAAKKSRDMRIKREKVIFEENVRLENMVKNLRSDNDGYITENKELHLKLGIILDENARLKALLQERN